MALADWLSRRSGFSSGRVDVPLHFLRVWLENTVPKWQHETPDMELLRAQVADRYRDMNRLPMYPSEFDELVTTFDLESRRRFALAVGTLELDEFRDAVSRLLGQREVVVQVREAFAGVAQQCDKLTLEVLRLSPVRIEEFARRLLFLLGADIAGESSEQSRQMLEKIDYNKLLKEAEEAKNSAESRLNELRKQQAQQERTRRGKW